MLRRHKARHARARRGGVARIYERSVRHEIPTASRPLPCGLADDLKKVDRALELIWHAAAGKWVLMRCSVAGAVPCEDILVKCLVLDRPPGSWLIGWVKQHDISQGGRFTPEESIRRYMSTWDAEEAAALIAKAKVEQELYANMADDLATIFSERVSVPVSGSMGPWHRRRRTPPSRPIFVSLQTGKRLPNGLGRDATAIRGLHRRSAG